MPLISVVASSESQSVLNGAYLALYSEYQSTLSPFAEESHRLTARALALSAIRSEPAPFVAEVRDCGGRSERVRPCRALVRVFKILLVCLIEALGDLSKHLYFQRELARASVDRLVLVR